MKTRVQRTASRCFATLRQLRSITTYRRPSSNPSFLHLSSAALIIATVSWSTCLSFMFNVSSQSNNAAATQDVATTSLTRSSGSACSRWRCWRTVHVLHGSAPPWYLASRRSHVSPTCRTDAGSGPPPLNGLRSNLPPVNSRRSRFSCCWCKGVERPVWLWMTLSFPSNFIPSSRPTVVLAIVLTT